MNLIFYILLIIIFILIFLLLKDKNIIITILCSLLILYIILNPKLCINSTISGVRLFFYKVFPALFCFLIISNLILSYNGIYIYSKIFGKILCKPLKLPEECSFVLIISALCGYPLGAKYACELYEKKAIDFKTTEKLLNVASNASPLFIIGAIGTSMLKNPQLGYLLLVSNYLSCIIIGILIPSNNKFNKFNKFKPVFNTNKNIGNILKESIENSVKTCLSIGGFVTLFSVINTLLINSLLFINSIDKLSSLLIIPKNILKGISLGIIEMTNGCYIISSLSTNIYNKIILISFLLSFSGLSIISQVYSFTYKFKFSIKKYISLKIIQGFFCSIISIILLKLYGLPISIQTINISNNNNLYIPFIIFIILIIPLILYNIKKLFHVS